MTLMQETALFMDQHTQPTDGELVGFSEKTSCPALDEFFSKMKDSNEFTGDFLDK